MANKKISELPIVTSQNDDDTFILNHLGSTYSVKLNGIADFVNKYINNKPPPTNNGIVTTLAGSTIGYVDGPATDAKFNRPAGVAVDSSGNVYVADFGNHKIRKITPQGVVTTYATATTALYYTPMDVAVDSSGNVYVADSNLHKILKITPAGVVSTFAGDGTHGYADGTGTAAKFNRPAGVAVDSSGNVYVADTNNYKIRKITPQGVVTTLAGAGIAGYAGFYAPDGVAVDSSGHVYVADLGIHKILKITPAGVVSTLAGDGTQGYADGTGTAAKFNRPAGVAVDSSGNVYVADTGNLKIRKITPAGVVTTLANSTVDYTVGYADGPATTARFYNPMGIAVDSSGNVYVADTGNNKIRKITIT